MVSRSASLPLVLLGLALVGSERASAQSCPGLGWGLATKVVGAEPWCATAGDLNGDGADDLILGRSPLFGAGDLQLHLNSGVGDFPTTSVLPGASSPRSLALGDLDGDGDLDLAVADQGLYDLASGGFLGEGLAVYAGDGASGLSALSTISLGASNQEPDALALGDLDGDGDLDAVVTVRFHQTGPLTADSRVLVFLNDGSGHMSAGGAFPADAKPRGMVLADLDGDQALDYATVNWESGSVSIVRGHGDGTFDATAVTIGVGIYASTIAAGDFDGDGDVDLVAGWKYGIKTLVNTGAGVFTVGSSQLIGYYPKAMATCDFDRDGHLDLVATFASSATLSLLRGNGTGSFAAVTSLPAGSQAYALALGDWNLDGTVDFATADDNGNAVRIHSSECASTIYCTAKVNSQGCTPAISSSGTASASSPAPFHVRTAQVLNQVNGMFLYGYAPAAVPLQGGFLCVGAPLHRTPLQSSGGSTGTKDCSGLYEMDFNARIRSGVDPLLVAGAQVYVQCWSRDVADPFGAGISLSDALSFQIQP